MEIYFDNSATTQPFECAKQAVLSCMTEVYYNPSALYAPAVKVSNLLSEVRADFAKELRVKEEEIIFTSGGTESSGRHHGGSAAAHDARACDYRSKRA